MANGPGIAPQHLSSVVEEEPMAVAPSPLAGTNSSLTEKIVDFQSVRSSIGEIGRQSALFFSSTVFALACNYFFKLFVARQLGARLIGWNALGIGIYSVAKLAGQMGLPGTAVRFVSAYRSTNDFERLRGFFWRGLAWSLLGAIAIALATCVLRQWLAVHLMHEPAMAAYLPLYALLIPVGVASSFLSQTFKGFGKAGRASFLSNCFGLPLMIVLSTIGFVLGYSLIGYVVAQVLAEFLTLFLIAAELRKLTRGSLHPWGHSLPAIESKARRFAVSFLGIGWLDFAMGHADRFVVAYFLGAKELGIYSLATSAAVVVPLVLQAVNSVFGPMISRLHVQQRKKLLAHLYQTLTKWTLGLTLPLGFVLVIFAEPLMGLFGPDFRAGWLVLVIISLAEIVDCGVGSVGFLLMMSGNEKRYIRMQMLLAPAILLLKMILIPTLGLTGAAIGAALAIVGSNLAYLVQVRKALDMQPLNLSYTRLLIPSLVAAAIVSTMRFTVLRFPAPILLVIPVALATSYLGFLFTAQFCLTSEEEALAGLAWKRARSMIRFPVLRSA
jgi:O-antigen/teichoic acid export membrane protein